MVLLFRRSSPVNRPRIPDDKVSCLKAWFLNLASSFLQPLHLFILESDVIMSVIRSLTISGSVKTTAQHILRPTHTSILECFPHFGEILGGPGHNSQTTIFGTIGQEVEDTLNGSELGLERTLIRVGPGCSAIFQLLLGQWDG